LHGTVSRQDQEEAMSRERSMQRMNALTLAAFLLGVAAFVFDSATPAPARVMADVPAWSSASANTAIATGMQLGLD
jgi:hypothetical protein